MRDQSPWADFKMNVWWRVAAGLAGIAFIIYWAIGGELPADVRGGRMLAYALALLAVVQFFVLLWGRWTSRDT